MGSGAETVAETVAFLAERGAKVGAITVHLYRPFSVAGFVGALPPTVQVIAALDRTKEPGAIGEPLYQDAVAAVRDGLDQGVAPFAAPPRVIGGGDCPASQEFSP